MPITPHLGHGIGLRTAHYADLLAAPPPADWVEAISENFMVEGGRPRAVLERLRRERPVVLHGVSLSIGSTDPLSARYLAALRRLADLIEPAWISDHLCWGGHGGEYVHDLWPLPYTAEALRHVVDRVGRVQDLLGRRILLENPSTYAAFQGAELSEAEFLAEVARRADCGILLDLNNVFVSARNHGFDALAYLDAMPPERVGQLHLAGHSDRGRYLLDTHDAAVPEPVWALYRAALARFGPVATLVEWDEAVPPLADVAAEARRAARVERAFLAGGEAATAEAA